MVRVIHRLLILNVKLADVNIINYNNV
ncbi:unnamed protein product, partial [Rotaria sp. Silwood2]